MIYLDIINEGGRYMRVRDDRFPGQEMLIPIEELAADLAASEPAQPEVKGKFPLLPAGAELIEPFIS